MKLQTLATSHGNIPARGITADGRLLAVGRTVMRGDGGRTAE